MAEQVIVGEFILYKPLHANITNAVTTTLHFIIDALAAFIVAILVYVVRALQHCNLLRKVPQKLREAGQSAACLQASASHGLQSHGRRCQF